MDMAFPRLILTKFLPYKHSPFKMLAKEKNYSAYKMTLLIFFLILTTIITANHCFINMSGLPTPTHTPTTSVSGVNTVANAAAGSVVSNTSATSVVPVGPSGLSLAQPSAGAEFTFPVLVQFPGKVANIATLDLRSNAEFQARVGMYESVRLVNIVGTISILPNANRQIFWCFTGSHAPPSSFLKQLHGDVVQSAINGVVKEDFGLPARHPFGTELKAAVLGNPAPVLHLKAVRFTNAATTRPAREGHVKLDVTVRVGGTGIPAGFAAE